MAFLDNSGDIILDVVLTDHGRKVLAKGDGSFQITKFAVGDEEIDYALYNSSHASGSAYYDLEILQTPILEAALLACTSLDLKTKCSGMSSPILTKYFSKLSSTRKFLFVIPPPTGEILISLFQKSILFINFMLFLSINFYFYYILK